MIVIKRDTITAVILSTIILMNSLQFALVAFGASFNMFYWEYLLLLVLLITNKFKITNIYNILILLLCMTAYCIYHFVAPSATLSFYLREFVYFAAPLLIAFSFTINYKIFTKVFSYFCLATLLLLIFVVSVNGVYSDGDYMVFGYSAIFCTTFLYIYGYFNKKLWLCGAAIIGSFITIINGNRGTIMIIAAAIFFSALLRPDNRKERFRYIILAIVLGLITLSEFQNIITYVQNNITSQTYSVKALDKISQGNNIQDFLGGRYDIYQQAIGDILERPLTGFGIGGFQEKYAFFPHNIILDIYVTFGVIIGTLITIGIIRFCKLYYKYAVVSVSNSIMFIFGISIIFKLLLSKTFIYDPFFWLFIASGISVIQQGKFLAANNEASYKPQYRTEFDKIQYS